MISAESVIATFQKGGLTPIEIDLQRTAAGLKIVVKTLPEVEQFMRDLGGGMGIDVQSSGRYWRPIVKNQQMYAYALNEPMEPVQGPNPYRLDLLGYPLSHEGFVNLSFLRLIGSSEGIGASFYVKGVYSLPGLRALRDLLIPSTRQFYIDYMKPVDLIVKVSTQELRL